MSRKAWTRYARKVQMLENKYRPRFLKVSTQFRSSFTNVLKTEGTQAARRYLSNQLAPEALASNMQSLYKEAGLMGARLSYTELLTALKSGRQKAGGFGRNEGWIAEVISYLRLNLLNLAQRITETMRSDVLTVLEKGEAEGWSIDRMVQELQSLPLQVSRVRTIVRTETVRAANVGHQAGARSLPFEVNKKWIAARDHRTRHSHRLVNNQMVDEDGSFRVAVYRNGKPTGQYEQMQHPGDPSASAANTINCFLPDELTSVNPSIVKKAFRSWYEGEIVTIETASKRKFTCTPNHPILTSSGWVKAGELTSLDNLVKSNSVELYSAVNLNIKDKPSSFQKLFDSFISSYVRVRVVSSIVDFHGDIPTGNVDIVDTNIKLRNRVEPFFFKFNCNNIFNDTNFRQRFKLGYRIFCVDSLKIFGRFISDRFVSFCHEISSLFFSSIRHSEVHGFAAIARSDVSFFKSNINAVSADAVFTREGFNANSGIEVFDNVRNIDRFSDGSHSNPGIAKAFLNEGGANADNISDLLTSKASLIESDAVVNVKTGRYSGHVYNFETVHQMYDINGYVAHNCRCRVTFEPKRDANGALIRRTTQTARVIPMQPVQSTEVINLVAALKKCITITVE